MLSRPGRPQLRTPADAILAWAEAHGARVRLRKATAALMGRRKFAEVAPTSKTTLTIRLRATERLGPPVEPAAASADEPFDRRIRLRSTEDLADEVFAALARALTESR